VPLTLVQASGSFFVLPTLGRIALKRTARIRLAGLVFAIAASGCSISQKHTVPPGQIRSALEAAKPQLVATYNEQAEKVRTLNASVRMSSVAGSAYSGVIQQYHEVGGFILAARPAMIRIIGQAPVVATNIFDMVSDGRTFRIFIPSKNKFLIGPAQLERPANNPIENLRPQHILEALFWPPIASGEAVLFEEFDAPPSRYYVLTILRNPGANPEIARKIWFDRAGLRISRVQTYGPAGRLDADIMYTDWQRVEAASTANGASSPPSSATGGVFFPREFRITRPQQDYQLTVVVTKIAVNSEIAADRFTLAQPSGTELVNVAAGREAQP
jgi:outer membrane lipoprotein-sorting protein